MSALGNDDPFGNALSQEANMTKAGGSADRNDPHNLGRFLSAQEGCYARVLSELRNGAKTTHWMWYIFPQIDGLGFSSTTKFYSIKSVHEARDYLVHPMLGIRLVECAEIVLSLEGLSALQIFGNPDDLKLRSSMTLFEAVQDSNTVFSNVLDKYFSGKRDASTLALLQALQN